MQWNSEQNNAYSHERMERLICKRKDEQYRGCQDEQTWQHRIAPDTVRASCIWFAATEDKDCAGSERVEEPFGEDGQREERLKSSDGKQQQGTQHSLQNQCRRGCVKTRTDVRELLEK